MMRRRERLLGEGAELASHLPEIVVRGGMRAVAVLIGVGLATELELADGQTVIDGPGGDRIALGRDRANMGMRVRRRGVALRNPVSLGWKHYWIGRGLAGNKREE